MTWLEQGTVNIKKGVCNWRIREWEWQYKGKDKKTRYKKTIYSFTTPLEWSHSEHYNDSFLDFYLFLVFDIDGNLKYDTHIQINEIDQCKRPQWLPKYPDHIENFVYEVADK